MRTIWEILYSRQMSIRYQAPPICENIFSGSSSPVIVLSQPTLSQVIGLVLGGFGNFRLSWNQFPGAICYNVYRLEGVDTYVIQAQCITDLFYDLTLDGTYVVTAITLEGESPFSEPIVFSGGGGGTSTVNVTATCTQASRDGFPGVFMIYRESGDTAGNLTVNFTLTGTAINGVDYDAVPLSAVIPNGSEFVFVDLNPIEAALAIEKVATLTITPSGTYAVGPDNTDVVLFKPPLFRIADYGGAEPLFTPPADASDTDYCEWDGTWNFFTASSPNDVWEFRDSQGNFVQPTASIQGKLVFFTHVSGPFLPDPPGSWQIAVYCLDIDTFTLKIVWEGLKTGGTDPSGVYTTNGSGSDPRLTVTVEAFP